MSKVPVTVKKSEPVEVIDADALQPVERRPRELTLPGLPGLAGWPFFSFSYSYTEVSAHGDTAQVRSHSARLERGRLVTESFEGEMPRGSYDQAVQQLQQQVAAQASLLLRSLTWFLPSPGRSGRDRE